MREKLKSPGERKHNASSSSCIKEQKLICGVWTKLKKLRQPPFPARPPTLGWHCAALPVKWWNEFQNNSFTAAAARSLAIKSTLWGCELGQMIIMISLYYQHRRRHSTLNAKKPQELQKLFHAVKATPFSRNSSSSLNLMTLPL